MNVGTQGVGLGGNIGGLSGGVGLSGHGGYSDWSHQKWLNNRF